MTINRRTALAGAISLAAPGAPFAPTPLRAQAWPSKIVRLLVPFAAGGPSDFIARLLINPLSEVLGQPVIVENRAGANGNLGMQSVIQGEPDGYTLLHTTVTMLSVNPILYPEAQLRPMEELAHISTTASLPNVLVVNPAMNIHSAAELVALAKSKPGGLTCATFGPGSSSHILGSLFQKIAGFEAVPVTYRGSAPALVDVMGGRVDFLFDSMTTSVEQVRAGTVRGLAVTSPTRMPQLPDLPTMREIGFPGFDLTFWLSLQVAARTPQPIVERLQDALGKVMARKDYADALRLRGAEPVIVPPRDLTAFITRECARWASVSRDIGLQPAK
ncbi:MAG: tripartite tricarboxylate transporter substrate binding protein [Phreatobacter sp.]|uniref:Bug family tripartite tricarboxylate transporter substrate binding protein n=1 Tax=Phreatobacter sp. TaxID=1966341 RepID=UPI001A597C54|nr:tripartite tricarboxylate transporter substrate binding protein [Phreatobacter sp.]MBL8571275.1 tripartite tricarboxylate transporter substrate binding protein [Phreatobacter sp.]